MPFAARLSMRKRGSRGGYLGASFTVNGSALRSGMGPASPPLQYGRVYGPPRVVLDADGDSRATLLFEMYFST